MGSDECLRDRKLLVEFLMGGIGDKAGPFTKE